MKRTQRMTTKQLCRVYRYTKTRLPTYWTDAAFAELYDRMWRRCRREARRAKIHCNVWLRRQVIA